MLVVKVREQGRTEKLHVLLARRNAEGYREILGLEFSSEESGAAGSPSFRSLGAHGLTGVALITSNAHAGLIAASAARFPTRVGPALLGGQPYRAPE